MVAFGNRTGVVVGLDGSAPVSAAVGWALEYARCRHLPLRIIAADSARSRPQRTVERRRELLDLTLLLCRSTVPSLPVSGSVTDDEIPDALVTAAHASELVVVGSLSEALGGTSAIDLILARAGCPVVVARSARWPNPASPVVVGLDGSDADDAPLSLAFDLAARTLAPLVGVHVRGEPVRRAVPCMTSSERLRAWATKYPQVRVRHRVAGGGAVPALLGQAKTAGMLVVGPAGPGGIVRRLVHEAACPVLVACGASDRTVESVGARGEVRF